MDSSSPPPPSADLLAHIASQGRLLDATASRAGALESDLMAVSSRLAALLTAYECLERKSNKIRCENKALRALIKSMRVAFLACKKRLIKIATAAIVDLKTKDLDNKKAARYSTVSSSFPPASHS